MAAMMAAMAAPPPIHLHTPHVSLRVATYNLWAKGPEGRGRSQADLDLLAATIAAVNPDVCLLQEVDFNTPRSGCVDQAQYIANRLPGAGYTCVPLPHTVAKHGGKVGMAILSRLPVADARFISLPVHPGNPQRCALGVTIGRLALWNVHLGLEERGDDAMAQVLALEKAVHRDLSAGCEVLLGGDFNCDKAHPAIAHLHQLVKRKTWEAPTWPTRGSAGGGPTRRIDYFFGSHGVRQAATNLVVAPDASDHCLLWIQASIDNSTLPPVIPQPLKL